MDIWSLFFFADAHHLLGQGYTILDITLGFCATLTLIFLCMILMSLIVIAIFGDSQISLYLRMAGFLLCLYFPWYAYHFFVFQLHHMLN